MSKAHREEYINEKYKIPEIIPTEAAAFKVERVHPVVDYKVPPGFKAEQLPLARVGYQVGEEKLERVMVAYEDVKEKVSK